MIPTSDNYSRMLRLWKHVACVHRTLSLPSHFLSYCTIAESCCSVQISTTAKHLERWSAPVSSLSNHSENTQKISFLNHKDLFLPQNMLLGTADM